MQFLGARRQRGAAQGARLLQLELPQFRHARGVKHVGARQGCSRRQSNRVQTDREIIALGRGFLAISQRSPGLRHPVRLGNADLFVVVLPVGPLAVLAAVDNEAAPGAGRELGDACAAFGAAAVATCLDFGGGDILLLLGRFGGRLGRGHLLGGRGGE